jgi:hypothetical protein
MMHRLSTYGKSNFESIILEKRYYIDKTAYIEKLENVSHPVFLRPRRFGKTLFTETLRWYYDIKAANRFDELFGELYIGKNPTRLHNTFFFLKLDFSGMGTWIDGDHNFVKKQFDSKISNEIGRFLTHYKNYFEIDRSYIENFSNKYENNASGALQATFGLIDSISGKLFIAIDEYDSLTNAMAIYYKNEPENNNEYLNILKKGGFFRSFFETIKQGTSTVVDQVYITGILPITIADMSSGYNIASWITFKPEFDSMLGFTETEFNELLIKVYSDYTINAVSINEAKVLAKNYYNGYKFIKNGNLVYNPQMTMFLIDSLIYNRLPDSMIDTNMRIDYNQIAYIFGNNNKKRDEIISAITDKKQLKFQSNLQVSFNMNSFKNGEFITEGLFYSGILTNSEIPDLLKIPNLVTYEFILSYFNNIMQFSTDSGLFTRIVDEYSETGDAKMLIDKFFTLVIQKYQGDFFKNVNESFYHGLLFYILWNSFAKDRYEVLPEFQVTNGQADIMVRTLPNAHVRVQLNDLFELKCLPKSASNTKFDAKLEEAKTDISNYRTGDYANWRGISVCFRGNLDYKIDIDSK